MLKWLLILWIFIQPIAASSQSFKTNLLVPVSLYYETDINHRETIQLGISYVPDLLTFKHRSDFSFIAEYRYYPKVRRLYPLKMNQSFPSGPFIGPYAKFQKLNDKGVEAEFFNYVGVVFGRKFMTPLTRRKWIFEGYGGIGAGAPAFVRNTGLRFPSLFEVRCGIVVGKHIPPKWKSKSTFID